MALTLGMHYTVYFGNKRLVLTDGATTPPFPGSYSNQRLKNYTSAAELPRALADIEAGSATVVVTHPNPLLLLQQLQQRFVYAVAAGGLVLAPGGYLLLIYRQGKWDLPKGHLDAGETLPDCAVREVMEETGLENVTIGQELGTTYHTYWREGATWLKASHWYLMESAERSLLAPQQEEGIEQCTWAKLEDLETYMAQTHPSIRDIVTEALPLLQRQ